MKIDFTFKTKLKVAEREALLDSGASENFIDTRTWEKLGIGRFRLPRPVPVHNVDGTMNKQGRIEYYCWLRVKLGRQDKRMKFYLTGLGKDEFILGYPFLATFNPEINWTNATITNGEVEIETLGFRTLQRQVREIQRAAIRACGKPRTGQALYIRKTTTAQIWARREREKKGESDEEGIPAEYKRHWKVFDEKLAQRFPPKREEDLRIELLPEAPTSIDCKVYPLSRKETDVLRTFIEEEKNKGYIAEGSSEYTAPVFFVGKKDSDELRPVMDYREINKWTRRDNNPLPNIKTALENLRGGELFSKFDVRWGYKNLQIREEDRHKAAFKTVFGTYIPKVTYFGLTNAPPAFQRTMHRDLEPLLQKYPRNLDNYLDDIWIVTKKDQEGKRLHQQITHQLLDLLEDKSYFLKRSKCQFEREEMDLLGWRVGNGEIRIDPDKIAGLREWPRVLRNVKEVRRTLGILGYQRPFIRGFANLA